MTAKSEKLDKKRKTDGPKSHHGDRGRPAPATQPGLSRFLSSPLGPALVVFFLSIGLYLNTLRHDFVWDDRVLIVDNPAVRVLDGKTVQKMFFEDFWRMVQPGGGYYRPLVTLSYHVEYKVFGGNPAGFHLINVFWNGLVCALVFLFVRMLFGSSVFALTASLIFAVYPVHSENVAWVSGRTDLLAALWSMVALICYVAAKQQRNNVFLSAALVCFMLALFAKESAACVPLIVTLIEYGPFTKHLSRHPSRGDRAWPAVKPSVFIPGLFFAVLGLYLLLRHDVIGTSTTTYPAYAPGVLGTVGLPLAILAGYFFKLVFPFRLNGEYDAPVPESFLDLHVLSGLALLALIVYSVVRYRQRPDLVLGAGIFLLGLAPVLNVIPIGEISAERFLYFPSLGAALILGSFFASALATRFQIFQQIDGRRYRGGFKMSRSSAGLVTGVFAVVLVAFAARTVTRNPDWRTENVLFAKTAAAAPNSFRAQLGLGMAAQRDGRLQEAVTAYEKALEIKPDYADALSNLAGIYVQQGKIDEATRLIERALQAAPNSLQILINLGTLYFEKRRFAEAASQFEKVVAVDPRQLIAQYNLGLIRQQEGNNAAARRHFEMVAGQHSMYNLAFYYLAVIENGSGNRERARQHARRFLEVHKQTDSFRRQAQAILSDN